MKGRWMAENTVIAQEVSHTVQKHKGKHGLMLMKLDMKKAYDNLEWSFLDKGCKDGVFHCNFENFFLVVLVLSDMLCS